MAKDEPYIRASNSRWAIISLILMNTVVQNESEPNKMQRNIFLVFWNLLFLLDKLLGIFMKWIARNLICLWWIFALTNLIAV